MVRPALMLLCNKEVVSGSSRGRSRQLVDRLKRQDCHRYVDALAGSLAASVNA